MPEELNLMNLAVLALCGVVAIKFPKIAAAIKSWWDSIPKPQTTVQVPPPVAPVSPAVAPVPPPMTQPPSLVADHPVLVATQKLMDDLRSAEKAAVEKLRTEAAAKVAAAGGA